MNILSNQINQLKTRGVKVNLPIPLYVHVIDKLKALKEEDPEHPNIKKLQILKNSYAAVYSPSRGRVYPAYKRAKNCRWMTSMPNIQSISKVSGPNSPRSCILPETGYNLISLDVSQGDVRVMAHYAKNKELIKKLNSGGDVHQIIADKASIKRNEAKAVLFGSMYGLHTVSLAEKLNISVDEASGLQQRISNVFLMQDFQKRLSKGGLLKTPFEPIKLDDFPQRTRLANAVASTLAMYIEYSIISIQKLIIASKMTGRIFLYIINHDELIYCVHKSVDTNSIYMLKIDMDGCKKFDSGIKMKVNLAVSETNYDKGSFVEVG